MAKRWGTATLALGAVGAGVFMAARRVAVAPPDPELERRAHATQYSGPWRHGFADVNGVRLHYAEMGSGDGLPVILLHGFPECWYAWHYVMPHLEGQFRLIAPDMRGYNLSSKPEGVESYKLDTVAQDIVALIEALGATQAYIVGHDWGGVVAWHLAMYYPERVKKLVVINAPHPAAYSRELRHIEQLLRSYYVFLFQLPVLPEAALRLSLGWSLPLTAAVPGAFPNEALDVYRNNVQQPGAATAMLNYYRALARSAPQLLREDHPVIVCPTMLLWGMLDFALVPELIEGTEQWVSNLRVERAPDSSHWVPEEKPGWVAGMLAEFLA